MAALIQEVLSFCFKASKARNSSKQLSMAVDLGI